MTVPRPRPEQDTPMNNSAFWKAYRKERRKIVLARLPKAKKTSRVALTEAEIIHCARQARKAVTP